MGIRSQRGQTLLELLVAISILVTTLVATIVLIVTSINASRDSRNKLIGISLAREGIEVVRNIRDSNWVDPASTDWDAGLSGGSLALPINDLSSATALDFTITGFSDAKATVYASGNFYVQGGTASGTPSSFYRLLYLSPICHTAAGTEQIVPKGSTNDCVAQFGAGYSKVGLRVIAEVHWPAAASNQKAVVEDRFYNWQTL